MTGKPNKSSGGVRKYGRNKVKCARYRAEGRREKNKARRIARDARRQMLRLAFLTATALVTSLTVGYLIALTVPRGPLAVLLGAAGGLWVGAVLLEAFSYREGGMS